jgi:pyruvate ferredoxin oxidoreductase delta subunit
MSETDEKGWKDVPRGGFILQPGNAQDYKTGGWRTFKPKWIEDKCIHCLTCWVCCPDASVKTEDGKFVGFDYDHCKGCGICESVCPVKEKAIVMIKEGEDE